jgi:nicotinamide-nucleotide amidase
VHLEIVTIGDELLLGFTVDTNAAHIARALAAIGISVSRRATVGDDERAIADVVRDALSRADGVITTGGLGPTSDDRSKPAIASLFGRSMVLDQPTLDALHARWARRGLGELPVTNRNQAMVPSGATLLENRHGSAPGIWLEDAKGKWVAMLPGVPREMRGMMDDQILPRLRERAPQNDRVVASRTLRTTGVAESRIADMLAPVTLPDGVDLAYLPAWEGVDLRLTVRDHSRDEATEILSRAAGALTNALGAMIYGEDGADLSSIILDTLRSRQWTIGVAESCTGGMLGMRLTAHSGSSDVVRGGIIAYHDAIKVGQLGVAQSTLSTHGAVSVETVKEMAVGVRAATGADVGVAISGVAGPGGGTPEKPVGTVCIAVDARGVADARASQYVGDRGEIRQRATQAALMMVRRLLASSDNRTSGGSQP